MAENYTVGDYRRFIANMREAVTREFPDRAANIYLADASRPYDEELARAAKQLNVPDLAKLVGPWDPKDGNNIDGGLTNERSVDNDKRVILFSYAPGYSKEPLVNLPDSAKISKDHFLELAFATAHEVGHALALPLAPSLKDNSLDFEVGAWTIHQERFAQLFASDVLLRNGIAARHTTDKIQASEDRRVLGDNFNPYAASDVYTALLGQYYPVMPPLKRTGTIENLHDSFDRTYNINETFSDDDTNKALLDEAKTDVINAMVADNHGPIDRKKIADWMVQRGDVFPDVAQGIRGRDYLAHHEPGQPYDAMVSKDIDLEHQAAAAWLHQAQTHDPYDYLAAKSLFESTAGFYFSTDETHAIEAQRDETSWAKAVLAGKAIVDLVPDLQKIAHNGLTQPNGTGVPVQSAPAPNSPPSNGQTR